MSISWSGSFCASSMSNTSMPANFLNRQPLPSITGLPASGPMLPRPSTAVPLVTTADEIAAGGVFVRLGGSGDDRHAGLGDARRIGEREIALRDHRLRRRDRDFSRRRKPVVFEGGFPEIAGHPGVPLGAGRAAPFRLAQIQASRIRRLPARRRHTPFGLAADRETARESRGESARDPCGAARLQEEVERPIQPRPCGRRAALDECTTIEL